MNTRFISLIVIIAVVAAALIFQATRTTSALVLLPGDLIARGPDATLERIRVGGRIAPEPITYKTEPEIVLLFKLENPQNPTGSIPVIYKGLKPDMFAAGRDVIIDGDYIRGTLQATKLLTQCPSKYEPPLPTTK